jgi:hypothetical protein
MQPYARRAIFALVLASFTATTHAALKVAPGWRVRTVLDTGAGKIAGGLAIDQDGSAMYCGSGTNIFQWVMPFTGSFSRFGAIPPNTDIAALAAKYGDVYAASGASFSPPFAHNFGRLRSGSYSNLFQLDGLFDAQSDDFGQIYLVANPGGAGTQIFSYDPETASLTSFTTNGGYSGGLAVRDGDGIYYADQNSGAIVKYADTNFMVYPVAASSLPPIFFGPGFDPNPVAVASNVFATYLSFDSKNRLLATTDFGNSLRAYDPFSGALRETIATDDSGGYGIGQIAPNWYTREIVTIFTDWKSFRSTVVALRPFSTPNDDDGNHIANIVLFNRLTAQWKIIAPESNYTTLATAGGRYEQPVAGDFDGDGIGDFATRNPGNGQWHIRYSSAGNPNIYMPAQIQLPAGPNVVPAPADYDGDGRTDPAVYNKRTGVFTLFYPVIPLEKILPGPPGTPAIPGGIPVPGDYNGDGIDEFCVYIPSSGMWLEPSGDLVFSIGQWGWSAAQPVPADYDGDGKTDLAVYDPATGNWYIWMSGQKKSVKTQFGYPGCVPVPADYDGDQKADIAVFDPKSGMFYALRSKAGPWQANVGGRGFQIVTP